MAEKPFEVGPVKAASTEVKAKKLLGFKTPARSIVSLPMGRASRIVSARNEFRARETAKRQRYKDGRFSWCALKPMQPGKAPKIMLAQKKGGAKGNFPGPGSIVRRQR